MMTFKTRIGRLIQAAALMTLIAAPVAQARELSLADSFPLDHYLSKEGTVWWMNRVTELTDGEITFQHFPTGQIGKADQLLRRVQDHVVDLAYVGTGYVSDYLPLNGAIMLPGVVRDMANGSHAYWSLLKDPNSLYRKEFLKNGVVPVFGVVLPPYQVVLNKPPIDSVDDFQGLNLRTSGSMNLTAEALGASAVSMAAPDIYLALQRGTLDGTLFPITSVMPYRIDEVIQSISRNGSFGNFGITVVMNRDSYNQLSDEQKAALTQAGNETVAHLIKYQAEHAQSLFDRFEKDGIAVYDLPDQVLKGIDKRLDTVRKQWVKRMKERGLNGAKALEQFRQAAK